MAKIDSIVSYLLRLRDQNYERGFNFSLTNLKLQKLLYFCEAIFAVSNNKPLIEDATFQAWKYGPVIPKIYYRYNIFGQNEIPKSSDRDYEELSQNEKEIIKRVWETLRDKNAFDLVEISHVENGPWYNAYAKGENTIIDFDEILKYYSQNREDN